MKRRETILLIVLEGMLVLTAAWSCQYMRDQRLAAVTAQGDLSEGLRMMEQIGQIGQAPTMAVDRARLDTETTGLIQSAAQAAKIDLEKGLKRISYDPSRPVGDTVYRAKPIQVTLQAITLRQLVDMASSASLQEAGLNVDSIRLSVPPESAADLWNVDLELTYLVYEPPKAGK